MQTTAMPRRQRGLTLVEALIAFVVLTLGMLTVVRLQPALRQQADVARQRSEATRLAQQEVERTRGGAAVAPVTADTRVIEPDTTGSPRYELVRLVDAGTVPNVLALTVIVRWADRAGQAQDITLATMLASSDPALAAARVLPR